MTDAVRDGITRSQLLDRSSVQVRQTLADAVRGYKWFRVLELLGQHRELVNATHGPTVHRCTPRYTKLLTAMRQPM